MEVKETLQQVRDTKYIESISAPELIKQLAHHHA